MSKNSAAARLRAEVDSAINGGVEPHEVADIVESALYARELAHEGDPTLARARAAMQMAGMDMEAMKMGKPAPSERLGCKCGHPGLGCMCR